ncbi:hypothetical protein U1737_09515 [Sphingomonas sp. LB3N6]|uniref:hypothetical protein n=1 Tax=Sphingomonas fucosidasi TaxID=3096164 RepID=UPI002FC69F0B
MALASYPSRMFNSLTVIIAALFWVSVAVAQVPQEDGEVVSRVDRARRVDRWPEAIRDSLVAPRWLTASDRLVFWDAIGPDAGSWVLVDAARGTRTPVISAAELRAQLAALTGKVVALPTQMPFVLRTGDRGLLFRFDDDKFEIDFARPTVRQVGNDSIDALLLDGAMASPQGSEVAVQRGDGFAVIDAGGRTLIARTGTPDLAWTLPDQPWSPDGRLAASR